MHARFPALAVLAIALSGCSVQPMRDPVTTRVCDSKKETRCDIKIVASNTGEYSCHGVRFDVDPKRLDVIGGRKVDIRWIIDARPLTFCAGDGIRFPFPFEAMRIFGEVFKDGVFVPPGVCVAEITLPWPADKLPEDSLYTYGLSLRNAERPSACAIDPWIFNGR